MPTSGACVIRYVGKRGIVWRPEYADSGGRQAWRRSAPNERAGRVQNRGRAPRAASESREEGLAQAGPSPSFEEALRAALTAADVEGHVRAFHDLRHTAITHDAASGSSAIAVMAKAGHRNMATTRMYLRLAGAVFRDEAARLEERLLGVESSTNLSSPERI
jgi:integrase